MEKRFRDTPFAQRRSKNKPRRKRFVIVCEGERTEADYFNYLLKGWRHKFKRVDEYVSIEIVGPKAAGGNMPPSLIAHAINTLKETERAKRIWDKNFWIWCVFDVEAEKRIPNLTNIVAKARRQKIQLAISNPCFELWFYLHYHYCDAGFPDGKTMKRHLKKWWAGYEKNAGEFAPLEGCYETAKRNAMRLRQESHSKIPSDPVPRPYTDVDKLITQIEAVLADLR